MSAPSSFSSSYVPVRAVGPPDAPFEGVLARGPDGATVLLVDRDALRDWPGWRLAPGEHAFAALDVVRRPDGHDVVLPYATERLDRFLARRAGHAALAPGEAVTVAVSVLRGVAAAVDAGADTGTWWLVDGGRPCVIADDQSDAVRRASAAILETLALDADHALGEALGEISARVADDRRAIGATDPFEDRLFALAAPEALAVHDLSMPGTPSRGVPHIPVDEPREPSRPWWHALAAHLDSGLADTVADTIGRARRRWDSAGGRRRLPLLVGLGVAAVVLAGGLLWPEDDAVRASDVPVAPAASSAPADATPSSTIASPHPETPDAGTPLSQDATPEDVLGALLDQRTACAGEAACLVEVVESVDRPLTGGAIDLAAAERRVELVDDLGGLLVLRVGAPDDTTPPQFVTIIEGENGWRVRDVYTVADPPS